MGHVLLKDVHQGSQNWAVDARAVRFTDFMSTVDPDRRVRIELILLDAEGNAIEAIVPEYWHKRSKMKLEEGRIYTIRYFQVIKPKQSYRAVDRDCMIEFGPHTMLEEPRTIPSNHAVSFDVLRSRIGKDTVTSDTVAILLGCSKARDQQTQKTGVKKLRNLSITDGLETINVALWGKHAETFDAEICIKNSVDKPMVLLLCAMTCREFNGKLSIQNSALSKWYMNPDIPEAHALRQSFGPQATPVVWLNETNTAADIETITVAELAALRIPHIIENKRFLLTAKIKEMESSQPWWYLACNKCNKGMRPSGNAFKCSDYDCPCTQGTERYRLSLRVVDPDVPLDENNTSIIQNVFFGPMAEEIIGASVHDLMNAEKNVDTSVPKQIEHLYGKLVTAKVSVGKFSFKNLEMSLQVNSIISVTSHTKGEGTSKAAESASQVAITPSQDIPPSVSQHEIQKIAEKSTVQSEAAETLAKSIPVVEDVVTPPGSLKRPCPSKDSEETKKSKRGEPAAKRKLLLQDEGDKE